MTSLSSDNDNDTPDSSGHDLYEADGAGIDPARVYFNGIARGPLLGREAEVALAKRIEASEHLMMAALLEVPVLRDELIRARAELPDDDDEAPPHKNRKGG